MSHADPIGSGHVASLARPGGNVTGLTIMMSETNAKALELLKEALPHMSRVAVIWDPATPSHVPGMEAVQGAAKTLALRIHSVPVRNASELENSFANISKQHDDALLVLSTPLFMAAANQLAALALKHKLPAMFAPREHAEAGGLISYGPDRADLYRRATVYVDKILRGARPSELPVQQATKFELVINLKTATQLGIAIPRAMLLRASEVIQ
jgi:putative ABC transport system substrate-binding protein